MTEEIRDPMEWAEMESFKAAEKAANREQNIERCCTGDASRHDGHHASCEYAAPKTRTDGWGRAIIAYGMQEHCPVPDCSLSGKQTHEHTFGLSATVARAMDAYKGKNDSEYQAMWRKRYIDPNGTAHRPELGFGNGYFCECDVRSDTEERYREHLVYFMRGAYRYWHPVRGWSDDGSIWYTSYGSDKPRREGDQPPPIPNESKDIQSLVIEDMQARRSLGIKRYGTALQANNGRDALVDLYEELLDAVMYAKQAIVERDNNVQAQG